MILVAFIAFAVLVVAWLIAPTGAAEEKTAPAPAPSAPLSDAPATAR